MNKYDQIKTWIWCNIIIKYWHDYIQDEINERHDPCYDNEYDNFENDLD